MWGEGSGGSKHRTRFWIPGGSTRKLLAGKQCWLVGGGEGEEDENASESADQLGREGLGGRGLDANTSQTRPLSMCPSKTREVGRTNKIFTVLKNSFYPRLKVNFWNIVDIILVLAGFCPTGVFSFS